MIRTKQAILVQVLGLDANACVFNFDTNYCDVISKVFRALLRVQGGVKELGDAANPA